MMKKSRLLFISIVFLVVGTITNQAKAQQFTIDSVPDKLTGIWEFSSAEFTITTGSMSEAINKITNIEELEQVGFPFDVIFRRIDVSGGELLCILGTKYGDNLYRLDKEGLSLIESKEKKEEVKQEWVIEELPDFIPFLTNSLSIIGNEIQLTSNVAYASTNSNGTIEGKRIFTFKKKQ